jgi:ribosomal protein S18 acetylase RimI-like enzyme
MCSQRLSSFGIFFQPDSNMYEKRAGGAIMDKELTMAEIEIRIVHSWDSGDIMDLYKAGGWWREGWDPAGIPDLISKSYAFAVAREIRTGQAVGMGRVISDGISDAYLQDVVVDTAYRHHGIGCRIVECLISYCLSSGIRWIGCIAAPHTAGFYQELGFCEMTGFTPMLYGGRGSDITL